MIKIGFWFDYDQTYTFAKVFNEMFKLNKNLIATGFVLNDRYYNYAQKNLIKFSNLVRFYKVFNECKVKKPNKKAYNRFLYYDEKYFLSKVMYSDRHLNKLTYNEVKNIFINLIEFFENFLNEEKIKIFFFNCVASSYAHLFYIVLKENNIKVIIPTITGVENRIFLADNPYEYFTKAYEDFKKLNCGKLIPDENIVKFAKNIINKIRNFKPAYKNRAVNLEKSKFNIPSIKRIAHYLINYYKYYKSDFTQPTIYEKIFNIIKFKYNLKKSETYFNKIKDIDTKFIYFPLHFEPEIATLVLSQYDQLAIIDIISKQIPLNWKLVIKEHPAMLGQRDYKFYKIIQDKYPNVLIIHPSENSQILVHKSEIVFSLCGTAIFESIVLKKPVIYTGKVRYEGFNLGIHSKEILNFDQLIKKAMNYKYEDLKIEYMIISILKNSYDFIFAEPLGTPETLDIDNIRKIAKAFLNEL